MGKTRRIAATSLMSVVLLSICTRGQEAPAARELGTIVTRGVPIELTARPLTVRIALREDSRTLIDAATVPASKTALRLTLEEIDYNKLPDVSYDVYLNLPEHIMRPSVKSLYYVGNLAFFERATAGAAHPAVRSFEVTKTILGLKVFRLWSDKEASVTFMVHPIVGSKGRQLPVPPGTRLRLGGAKIVAIAVQP
jgi:hypothetical protein